MEIVKTQDYMPVVRCRDCKYFEVKDYFFDNTPILAASNVPTCHKWSDGCLTNQNGYCHLGERRDSE